jgi:exosome complex exonuclease RRP6
MNNSLFQLAERPPSDMASLLAAFKHIPPVIRRRAKELLDTIQDTVKEHRETASSIKVADQIDNTMAPTNVEMSVTATVEVSNSSAMDVLNSRLWSQGSCNSVENLNSDTISSQQRLLIHLRPCRLFLDQR